MDGAAHHVDIIMDQAADDDAVRNIGVTGEVRRLALPRMRVLTILCLP
jgi:hypothetical protein